MKAKLFSLLFAIVASVGTLFAWDYEKVQIGNLYYNLDATNLVAELTKSGNAYSGLSTVDIPASVTHQSATYSVTSIGEETFWKCSNLTSVTIPNSVTTIGAVAFTECSSLTSMIMPNSVTSMGYDVFDGCSSLTLVSISSGLTEIDEYTFTNCTNLPSVTIPSNISFIGTEAFKGCTGLTSVTCEATTPPTLDSDVFGGVDKSIPLYVPEQSISLYQDAYQWSDFTNILAIGSDEPVPQTPEWVREGDEWNENTKTLTVNSNPIEQAYYERSEIIHVIISDGVTSIGNRAFSDCTSLTTIDIPSTVTSIGNTAFNACGSLASVSLPSGLTSIATGLFYSCSSLTSITIPSSVASIGSQAFSYCDVLTFLSVDAGNAVYDSRNNCNAIIETATNTLVAGCQASVIPSSVTSIKEEAFSRCTGLTSVEIPSSVTSIGYSAFEDCEDLTSVTILSSVTSIGNNAFAGCSNLTSVTLPSGLTSIASGILFNCTSLTSIDIPSTVTNIAGSAFERCSRLGSIDLPSGVTNIDDYAFEYCSGLTSITCRAANAPELGGNDVFKGVDKSIPLYVPAESVAAYQSASGWSEFTNIRAIGGSNNPMFPDDPGELTYGLELSAAVIDGGELPDFAPTGAGGYPAGTEVIVTAQDIPGYEFVRWSDDVTDKSRTVVVNESLSLTALYSHSMIEIAIAANQWNFICLPPLGDRQYSEEMFTYDGLSGVKWGTYNGEKRAAGQSGWETPETFNAMQGYILYSTTAGTLRINAYEDEIRQGESGSAVYAGMTAYAASHPENESWNFLGNPYNQGYNIAGLAVAGIEAPITVWNGTAYSTYTPGIDEYTLQPFEAFFIQKSEGTEGITFSPEYLEGEGSVADALGTLPGYFSVGEGVIVRFSKGNLQYRASTDTWQFAENQYDYVGEANANISETYDGWIDLFGWGTGDNPTFSSTDNREYTTFVDWGTNAISNGGKEANLWRTLTKDEWGYIFQNRDNATTLYGLSSVDGINGMIILPDDWQGLLGISFTAGKSDFAQNTYSLEQWSMMEQSGAVFLPCGGYRTTTEGLQGVHSYGNYWSATYLDFDGATRAYYLDFYKNTLLPQNSYYRGFGRSVRLVR